MGRKTSFYYSFLVLPADERRAIIAVWDLCRAIDDAVDEEDDVTGPKGREAIPFWRSELTLAFNGGQPTTTQALRLQPHIARFNLSRTPFDDLIDGVAMDLDTNRYETFPELYEYCRRVASAVGMVCIQIWGCHSEQAKQYALNLGLALQLTNIIRDIPGDMALGRIYLPLEDLRQADCTVEELKQLRLTPSVQRVIKLECERAREFYAKAAECLPLADRPRLVAAEIMRAVYAETLSRIERSHYDVFSGRARVPRPRQALIALGQWLWPH